MRVVQLAQPVEQLSRAVSQARLGQVLEQQRSGSAVELVQGLERVLRDALAAGRALRHRCESQGRGTGDCWGQRMKGIGVGTKGRSGRAKECSGMRCWGLWCSAKDMQGLGDLFRMPCTHVCQAELSAAEGCAQHLQRTPSWTEPGVITSTGGLHQEELHPSTAT